MIRPGSIATAFLILVLINIPLLSGASTPDSISAKKKTSYWETLINGNIDRTYEKALDVTFAGAPSYTREAGFGIGGMATGLYRVDKKDSIMPPSDITLIFNASLNGFYSLEARGNHYFKGNTSLLSYQLGFTTKNLDFWGISHDACAANQVIDYTRQQAKVAADYQLKLSRNFFVGMAVDFSYNKISRIDNPDYLEGQRQSYVATGIGLPIQYDSRPFIPNPKQGFYFLLRPVLFPQAFGNCNKTLFRLTINADAYRTLWKGSVLAVDLYARFNSDDSPWPLREELGGNYRMRGYYSGRYIDNNILSGQIELRQHLYRRLGLTTWVGGGGVFESINKFKTSNLLPNAGIGLRFEIKHNVNFRVDYGFGKDTRGFVFNIGEAF